MAHCHQLIRRQIHRDAVTSNRLRTPHLRVPAMNDDGAVGQFWRAGRTPVDVGLRSVPQHEVSQAAGNDAPMGQRTGSFDRVPPDETP